MELFSIPAVSGIIEKKMDGTEYILILERWKEGNNVKNGLLAVLLFSKYIRYISSYGSSLYMYS